VENNLSDSVTTPDPAAAPAAPVKVHVITGFLGAGKTTLLRRLLEEGLRGERVAVLVNEFGEVGIDGGVLKRWGHEVVELASGCVCCEIGGDLLDTLTTIIHNAHPDRLVLELSGLADPGSVLASLTHTNYLLDKVRIEPTICVVDAPAFGSLDKDLEFAYFCQLQTADIILINKLDRIAKDELAPVEAIVTEQNPKALQLPCQWCDVDLAALFDSQHHVVDAHHHDHDHQHTAEFDTFVFQDPEVVLDKSRVDRFLDTAPRGLFRVKGTVRSRDRVLFLNWVRGSGTWEPATPSDAPPTTLVFIGRKLDREALESGLRACTPRRGISLSKGRASQADE
jgi:G3E family GTPase